MFLRLRSAVLGVTGLLAACSDGEIPRRFVPDDADRASREYLMLLTAGRVDSAARLLHLGEEAVDPRPVLTQLTGLLRGASVDSARLVGAHTTSGFFDGEDQRNVSLTYELRAIEGWRLATINSADPGGLLRIVAVKVDTLPASLAQLNAFQPRGKSPRHYLWLIAGIVSAATCLVSSVLLLVRTRGMPRRSLWAFLALIGLGKFSLNWTTGAIGATPIAFQLLGAGFMRAGPVAPWIVSFSLPILGVIALTRRRRWLRSRAQSSSESATSAA